MFRLERSSSRIVDWTQILPVKRIVQVVALLGIAGPYAQIPCSFAAEPAWANEAASFPEQCWHDGAYKYQDCKPMRIPSPDGSSSVEVFYRPVNVRKDGYELQAFLRVTTPIQGTREAALSEGFQKIDLFWSPDSKSFFVNGGDGGSY